jgi:hypothetical protein
MIYIKARTNRLQEQADFITAVASRVNPKLLKTGQKYRALYMKNCSRFYGS